MRTLFPDLTEPDESYHGISYTETYGKKAYIVKARMQLMRDFGVYPAAHSAFLLNLGLETLAVRMKQYCENAMTVAKYLATLLPLFPDDFLCYFSGLIKMNWKKFVWIIILGKPWCILGYSIVFGLIQ